MLRSYSAAVVAAAWLGLVQPATAIEPGYVGTYKDVTESGFVLEALADGEMLGPYAICKAADFVNRMPRHGARFALTYPIDIEPKAPPATPFEIPAGWQALRTTAYVVEPFPAETEAFDLAQWSADCRRMFEWFR